MSDLETLSNENGDHRAAALESARISDKVTSRLQIVNLRTQVQRHFFRWLDTGTDYDLRLAVVAGNSSRKEGK